MVATVLADTVISISELKKNPMSAVAQGGGFPVAVLNRNQPEFYCIPADSYAALLNKLEDLELNALADSRAGQTRVPVKLDDL
ncbi:MAG: plasmid stabilization protein [Zetaproteobacteria bacterium CG_4_9_14_3_um_filter_49_83]|nr:MAG: plasmid stabilization protein [Zetaproteobacteria bacterium CG1_02_49_23]PIQ34237.1 MAG: plasmid stabilization protein [Zetaproteobacteria bacterium CG17_big_fil_post_rev_8_21_14_2_50_50_13]PIY57156.1 MAG: plasmid stabilization protein [Zetaproteobacteria bacterium CG_4_10_14_0_8_um_filter_49_80]PJA33938.1 MAG: plasmid stabilization protein [Zetaproteobacteria bacterium CG_4_9_14_3_um_filter_49_83]